MIVTKGRGYVMTGHKWWSETTRLRVGPGGFPVIGDPQDNPAGDGSQSLHGLEDGAGDLWAAISFKAGALQ